MQELEELVKSAKLDGFSQDEFTKALLRNPKYKGVNPEQIASAWGSGVKKKDQPLAPSSPGAKTASTESPLQSGSKEQPTPSTSELEPAPSLSRAAGLRDVDSRYGPVLSALPEQERTKIETGKGIPKSVTGAERKLNELKAGSYTALGNLLSIQNSAAEQIAMGLKSIGVPENVASTLELSIKSAGSFNPYVGEEVRNKFVEYNTKMAEDIKAKNDAYNMSFDEALERGEIGEALDIATGAFVESLPQMAAIVAAGATTGPLGAGVYGQVSSFDSYKRQLMRDYGIDEDQAKKVAFGLATVEGAMDGLTGGMAKFGAKAIKDLGKEAGEKAIKGFAQKVISNPAAVFLGGSLGEAGTEAATQLGQNAILKATVDPELDLMNGVKLAGAAGLIGGGTFSTPVVIASTVGKVSDIKKRNEVNKKIDELSIALDNGEIPSYMTEEVKAQRDALVAEKRKMFTDDLEFYNSMSEDDRNKVTDINTKIKSLSDDIKSGKVTRDSFEAVRDVAKNLIVEKQNIEQKYVSQEGKQVPGTEQGGEAVVQTEPVEGAGKKETPAGRVLQAPEKTVGTVRGLLNRRATFSDPVSETIVEGDVYQDGQRVVIETEEGKIFDIGNIDEIQDRPTSELGLSESKGRISVNEDGSFTYNGGDNQKIQGGTVMVNRQTGLKSIKRGKDGSIKTVSLTSPDGTETYNLKGQDAVDAAYQVMLNFSTSPEQSARVEQMLQQNEKARTEIESARIALEQAPETTTEEAVGDTVDDTVGGDGPRVGGVVGKQATTQEIKARTASDPQKGSLYNAVRRASKTLSSIIPDATYVFVDSDAEAADYYKANMADVDAKEKGSDKGRIFQNKNTGKVEIIINTSKADDVTVYHELFHAAFFNSYAQDPKITIDFANRLAKILASGNAAEKAIAKKVLNHTDKYKGESEGKIKEEFLSELGGIMTADSKSITQGMASKLANFFNKIAKAMGMDPVFKEAATTKEVVDFMNSFAKAAREGAVFEPKKTAVGREITTSSSKATQQDGKETKQPAAGNRLFNEPLKAVKSIADKYFKGAFGTERPTFEGTRTLDKARAKRISDAFDAMKHSPNDPEVAAAYEALAKETIDQYNAFLDAGYTVEINNEEPYANSQEMIDDLRNNKRIKIFSTESGFGETPITAKQRKENPLLATTKFKDVNGEPMLINDLFRAVHDFYGHAELGNSFGPLGEENAWNVHARMFSPLARRAMTSETRGQNSYVNFSGVNEKADKLREKARKLREEGKIEEAIKVAEEIYGITSFAEQKIGLLPEEFSQIDGFEARSSKFDGGKKSFSKSELDELDNSPYTKSQIEAIINKGKYALMSAENPQAANTVEDNDARTARAEEWLTERGYGNYTKIYGVFENKENSFLVPDMTMKDAEAFRKEFDQVSVAHSDGYMYEGGVDPRDEKANEFGIDYTDPKNDNYSIIKDSEGNAISFRTSYKWGTKEDLDKAIAKSNKKSRPSVDAMIIVDELATEGAVKPTAMQKVKDNALRAFVLTPEQQLVRSYKETQQSMVGRAGKKIRVQAEALNKLLGKNDELRLAVTAYLSGDLANSYDIIDKSPKGEQIFDLLTDMRAFVDSMSSDLTTSPSFMALPDALKATIQTNIGTYLRTSYRFWKDKNYTIDKAMRREAIAHQFDSNIAYELDKLLKDGMSPDDAEVKINSSRDEILRKAEKQIDEYIAEIERIRNTPEFKASGVVTSGQIKIPSDQLSGKKTVPEYIQQLLGVEKDPVVRFVDTAVALANIKYKGEMVYKIVTSLGADSIKTADQVTDGQIKSREFIKVNDKFSPLNDMYVHKDVFDVINNEDIYSSDIAWVQGYFNILKLSRKSKVIYNSPTWRKNITGGWQIMLANGVINTSTITDLINRAKFLAGKEDPEVTALLDRMAEFGLVGTDVNADIVGNLNSIYVSSLTGDTKLLEKASSYIKSADAKLGEKYSAIDDYTKMIIFRNKRDNAAKKMFGKPFSELTEAEQYKSDAALAEEIKSTTPTFSRLPPLYKKIAKFPVGDFLSFKLEAARSISNVFITAVEDIKKSTDPKLSSVQRKAYAISGVSKLMGASTALSMAYVVPAMLSSMFLGDDEELYEDALKLRANWMDGHNLVVKKVYPDGRIAYYDLSMEDTYGDITNTIFQLSNGELEGAIKSLAADVQPNMAVELLASIFTGKNEYAGDLYESYDPLYTKALKLAGHSIKSTIAPPSAYSSGRDASKAVEDNPELNWTQEFLTRFVKRIAVRDYESNAGKQFYYVVKESSDGITKDEQYTKLTGGARENRFEALSDMREEYLALTKISQYYGNKELKSNAKSAVKRYLNKDEEAYVLRGKIK